MEGRVTNILCPQCKQIKPRLISDVNRACRLDLPLYCGRICASLARRKYVPEALKKLNKREYDVRYRAENLTRIKARKAAYFQRTYDPIQAAIDRKKRMPYHVEYCRQPKYKALKKIYDRKYRSKKIFADFNECYLLLLDIEKEIASRASKTEIRTANGTLNKAQERRRQYAQIQFEEAVLRHRHR